MDQGLIAPGSDLTGADREHVLSLRETLRKFFGAGAIADAEVADTLNRAAATALLRVRFTSEDLRFEAAASGLDGAIARLMLVLEAAKAEGRLPRLKICAHTDCRRVFYDHSNNRAGKWCRPRCGSQFSARAFRRRRDRYDW